MTWDTAGGGVVNAMASTTAFVARRTVGARRRGGGGLLRRGPHGSAGPQEQVTAEQSTGQLVRRPVVDTAYGPVRGIDDGTSRRGREFATPRHPSASCAGGPAAAATPWTEPADASRVGPVCPQPTDPRIPIDLGAPQGDDCLTLNVWASSDTEPGDGKPVMVWVHGGAYILGSSAQPLYDGRVLARRR